MTKVVEYTNRTAAKQTWTPPEYLWLAVLLAVYTGLRRANILGLRWRQVDLGQRAIRIEAGSMKAGRAHEVPIQILDFS